MKNFIVVQDYDKKFHVWSKFEYDRYIRRAVGVGAGSAYKVVIDFDGKESLLDESPSTEVGQDELTECQASFIDHECFHKKCPAKDGVCPLPWHGDNFERE